MPDRTEVILEEIRGWFEALADGLAGNTEAVYDLRERVTRLEVQQNIMAGQISGLKSGQDGLRKDVKDLRKGQDELRQGQGELRKDLKELHLEFKQFRRSTEKILANHENRLTVVEASMKR